jgi:hypothetical protein
MAYTGDVLAGVRGMGAARQLASVHASCEMPQAGGRHVRGGSGVRHRQGMGC